MNFNWKMKTLVFVCHRTFPFISSLVLNCPFSLQLSWCI